MKPKTEKFSVSKEQTFVSNLKVKKWFWINKILLIAFVSLILGCKNIAEEETVEMLPYYSEATFTPHWFDKNDDSLAFFHTIPSFEFTNQDGEIINENTFSDKIYVADFFFTSCPGICPKMTKNLNTVQQAFLDDPDVMIISHSVTPERDSVEVLKTYAEKKNVISGKWHLATGKQNEIYNLGRNAYFIEEDLGLEKEADEFLHTENFVLIDKNKHIRGIYNGLNRTSVQQLISDIKTLKTE